LIPWDQGDPKGFFEFESFKFGIWGKRVPGLVGNKGCVTLVGGIHTRGGSIGKEMFGPVQRRGTLSNLWGIPFKGGQLTRLSLMWSSGGTPLQFPSVPKV